MHSQLIVSRKQLWWNLKKSKTRKSMCHLDHHRRFPTKKIGRAIRILMLGAQWCRLRLRFHVPNWLSAAWERRDLCHSEFSVLVLGSERIGYERVHTTSQGRDAASGPLLRVAETPAEGLHWVGLRCLAEVYALLPISIGILAVLYRDVLSARVEGWHSGGVERGQ